MGRDNARDFGGCAGYSVRVGDGSGQLLVLRRDRAVDGIENRLPFGFAVDHGTRLNPAFLAFADVHDSNAEGRGFHDAAGGIADNCQAMFHG